jgi:hypothetical protein
MTNTPSADLILVRVETMEHGPLRRTIVDAARSYKNNEYRDHVGGKETVGSAEDAVRLAVRSLALTIVGETIVDGILRSE